MIPICDVPPLGYYAIFVIPESRIYEFHKHYSLYTSPLATYYNSSSETSPTNGSWPSLDNIATQVRDLMIDANFTKSVITYSFERLSIGMSVVNKGCFLSRQTEEFKTALSQCKVPIFTSPEKALEFLIDITRILHASNNYIEFKDGKAIERVPEELSIIRWSQEKVIEISMTEPLVINAYVPGFLN